MDWVWEEGQGEDMKNTTQAEEPCKNDLKLEQPKKMKATEVTQGKKIDWQIDRWKLCMGQVVIDATGRPWALYATSLYKNILNVLSLCLPPHLAGLFPLPIMPCFLFCEILGERLILRLVQHLAQWRSLVLLQEKWLIRIPMTSSCLLLKWGLGCVSMFVSRVLTLLSQVHCFP